MGQRWCRFAAAGMLLAALAGLWTAESRRARPAAALAEGPSLKELKARLTKAIDFRSEAKIRELLKEIAQTNELEAARLIVSVTRDLRDLDLYDVSVEALAGMDSPKVRAFVFKEAKGGKQWLVRYLLLGVVARIAAPESAAVLSAAALEPQPRIQQLAFDILASTRMAWAVDALIEVLEAAQKKPELADRASGALDALQQLTGKGIEAAADWRNWWSHERTGFQFPDPKRSGEAEGPTTVVQRLQRRKEEHFFNELAQGDIVVVEGVFDQVQDVLKELKLPYELVERPALNELDLKPHSVLVFNCHETEKNRLSQKAAQRVQKFVEAGGYVFTSDWELQNIIQPCFPGTVGMSNLTQEQDFAVKIQPNEENFDHPYLRDVFPKNPFKLKNFRWKIDPASSTLRFPAKGAKNPVYPLVESSELAKRYGNPSVAVTFRWGRGSVLHVLSHFHAQRDADGDGFALQQLLANFIIEKQKWRRAQAEGEGKGKKKA